MYYGDQILLGEDGSEWLLTESGNLFLLNEYVTGPGFVASDPKLAGVLHTTAQRCADVDQYFKDQRAKAQAGAKLAKIQHDVVDKFFGLGGARTAQEYIRNHKPRR